MLSTLLLIPLVIPIGIVLYVFYTFFLLLLHQHLSPLRHLPGPPSHSFFMGNLPEMHDQENTRLVARWVQEYGNTFIYRGFIGGCRLMTTDPLAVAHIMSRAYDFPKPDFIRDSLATMVAGHDGLLVVEGEDHRRQRKILTPAFSSSHIKTLTPIFWEKAVQLRDIWFSIIDSPHPTEAPSDPLATSSTSNVLSSDDTPVSTRTTAFLLNPFSRFVNSKAIRRAPSPPFKSFSPTHPSPTPTPSSLPVPTIDVLPWLARAALDIIGEAGFGYQFNALSVGDGGGEENELAEAFGVIFGTARKFRVITILQVWFPVLRRFRRNNATMSKARNTMRRIGLELIEERRKEILAERPDSKSSLVAGESEIDGDKTRGRDLLSVLIRSNLSSNPSQQLSINEMLCQISTFLAAGHETTAAALTWTLYALARSPQSQRRLRAELRTLPSAPPSGPSADLLASIARLPYLEAVLRESLRLHSPITSTMRVALHDSVIPLERPLRTGETAVRVRKGDIMTLPFQEMNRGEEVWGEDGEEFRPERWVEEQGEEECDEEEGEGRTAGKEGEKEGGRKRLPGLWANIMTFGNGNPVNGNRACIGYRFALSEIKIFLFVLLRDLEFTIDAEVEIEKKINVVTRPCVKSEPHMGNQMPLRVRRVSSEET